MWICTLYIKLSSYRQTLQLVLFIFGQLDWYIKMIENLQKNQTHHKRLEYKISSSNIYTPSFHEALYQKALTAQVRPYIQNNQHKSTLLSPNTAWQKATKQRQQPSHNPTKHLTKNNIRLSPEHRNHTLVKEIGVSICFVPFNK